MKEITMCIDSQSRAKEILLDALEKTGLWSVVDWEGIKKGQENMIDQFLRWLQVLGDNITIKTVNDKWCISFSDGFKEAFFMNYCPEYESALMSLLGYAGVGYMKKHEFGYLYFLFVLSYAIINQNIWTTDDDCMEDWIQKIKNFIPSIDPKREYHLNGKLRLV